MKRTPLKRPTVEQVRAYEQRQQEKALLRPVKPRKPIARRGARAKRQEASWALCKATVQARAHGQCERIGCRRAGCDTHHVHPEDRDYGLHDPARCLLLCRACHDWTHANPAEAKALGLLRPDRH